MFNTSSKSWMSLVALYRAWELPLKVTWSMMEANNHLYTFFTRSSTKKYDYMKDFGAYIKAIKYYGIRTRIHHGIVKSNLREIEVQDTDKLTTE